MKSDHDVRGRRKRSRNNLFFCYLTIMDMEDSSQYNNVLVIFPSILSRQNEADVLVIVLTAQTLLLARQAGTENSSFRKLNK